MLDDGDLRRARSYNRDKSENLWDHRSLPWPISDQAPNSTCFALMVAQLQDHAGLKVDGLLGPNTYSIIRALSDSAPHESDDSEEARRPPTPLPPPQTGASNRVIIGGRRIALPQRLIDAGIRVTNHVDDGDHAFDFIERTQKVRRFVLHESVTRSAAATVRVLEAKKRKSAEQGKRGGRGYPFGVHFIGAPDGHISQHADLLTASLTHAGLANRSSIGWEIVNPYYGKRIAAPFDRTIPARWWTWVPPGAPRVYTLPTEAQIKMVRLFVPWVCEQLPDLPFRFPTRGLNSRQRRITNYKTTLPPAGVVAHRDFSTHADGRFLLEELMNGS